MPSSVPPVTTGLLERLLGTANYNVVLAVSANIISWIVATLVPSKLPRLLPFIPEEAPETDIGGSGSGTVDVDATRNRTRCVAVGRPGGMEQLRIIRLKQGYVTCGYNLPGYDSPFVDISDSDKLLKFKQCTMTAKPPWWCFGSAPFRLIMPIAASAGVSTRVPTDLSDIPSFRDSMLPESSKG